MGKETARTNSCMGVAFKIFLYLTVLIPVIALIIKALHRACTTITVNSEPSGLNTVRISDLSKINELTRCIECPDALFQGLVKSGKLPRHQYFIKEPESLISPASTSIPATNTSTVNPSSILLEAKNNNTEKVKRLLLETGDDKEAIKALVKARDSEGFFPLSHALRNKNLELVKLLLSYGAVARSSEFVEVIKFDCKDMSPSWLDEESLDKLTKSCVPDNLVNALYPQK